VPKYTYKCTECATIRSARHGMKDKLTDCEACGIKGVLTRVITDISLQVDQDNTGQAPGHVVKKFIEETRQEIEEKKKELTHVSTKN